MMRRFRAIARDGAVARVEARSRPFYPAKVESSQGDRGFKSLRLRSEIQPRNPRNSAGFLLVGRGDEGASATFLPRSVTEVLRDDTLRHDVERPTSPVSDGVIVLRRGCCSARAEVRASGGSVELSSPSRRSGSVNAT